MKLNVITDENGRPWYDQGLRFTCTQCGNCCTGGPGYVWITKVEIARLAEHLDLTVDEVIDRYCRRIGTRYSLKERRTPQGKYDCIFLEEITTPRTADDHVVHTRRICRIYPVRPLQCRTWPFWEGSLQSPEDWERAGRTCPGMDRGRHYTREQIEALRDARDWPENPPASDEKP